MQALCTPTPLQLYEQQSKTSHKIPESVIENCETAQTLAQNGRARQLLNLLLITGRIFKTSFVLFTSTFSK